MKDPIKVLLAYTGKTMNEFAMAIGKSIASAYRTKRSPKDFTIREVELMSKMFGKTPESMFEILRGEENPL